MRAFSLVLVFAACGGSGDGAVLSFAAPDGPTGASRIEIILASADGDAMTATRQRMRPGALMEEQVIYYRQRSTVDAIEGVVGLDGFEIRIEPDPSAASDETFVPFALIYDAQDTLVAVGTVNDEAGSPTPVIVKPGTVAAYDVAVVKVAPDVDAAGIAAGQGHAMMCQGKTGPWRSGAVWKPVSGPQIRLLLPDTSEDPDASDAMLRSFDLDCDDHPADHRDCDDLRTAYHSGQVETCDGNDTDCDGRRLELIPGCAVTTNTTCSPTGVSLCGEATPNEVPAPGTCMQTAACGCDQIVGTTQPGCAACKLGWTAAQGGIAPCAPSVGKLHFPICDPPGCTIDVVGVDGPWEVKIGATEVGPFQAQLTAVTTDNYFLRAKYLSSAPFPTAATSFGAAYISISPAVGRPTLIPINLQRTDDSSQLCTPAPSGNNFMICSQ